MLSGAGIREAKSCGVEAPLLPALRLSRSSSHDLLGGILAYPPSILFTSAYGMASASTPQVPADFSSSAARRSRPSVARINPDPTLRRATPSFSSSAIEGAPGTARMFRGHSTALTRSEEHTSELQSLRHLV